VDLFAIDDAAQQKPKRPVVRPLVAVGGLYVPGGKVRALELSLDRLCTKFEFPKGEEFKWSPGKKDWQRENLTEARRTDFFLQALRLAREAGAQAIVAITDTGCALTGGAKTHREMATVFFLERAQNALPAGHQAIAIFDRPSGGDRKAETAFLESTLMTIRTGTTMSKLNRLALAVVTDSKLSRLVQLADVVTSCTASHVAHGSEFTTTPFVEGVLPMMRCVSGCRGGRGLKLSPDFRYRNLHHWLLGDDEFRKDGVLEHGLPSPDHHYATSATRF
jgi:hypothetical protein